MIFLAALSGIILPGHTTAAISPSTSSQSPIPLQPTSTIGALTPSTTGLSPSQQSDPTGPTSWTSFSIPQSDDYSCVYYSSYVYCQGQTYSYYAALDASGPSAWTAGPSYPISLTWGPACVQADGYMTCVGGSTSSGAVYSSALSSSGFGGWTATSSYQTNIEANSCVQYSGYIYCVAGYSASAYTSSVYYATLTNGVVGSWTPTTSYPVAVDQLSCFVSTITSTSYITCTGGTNIGNGITTYYATISPTEIGSWTSGAVPNNAPANPTYSIADVGCAGDTTITYCIGGVWGSSPTPMTTYVTNPTVGWETGAEFLPASVSFKSSTGCILDSPDNILLCLPSSSTTGYFIGASALVVTPTSLSWYPQNKVPTADGYTCVYYAGYIFCVGAGGETYYATASYGTVGTWQSGPTYPVVNTVNEVQPACVANAGYIYCIGGAQGNVNVVSSTYYTTIGPSGFGPWTSTTPYPVALALTNCQEYDSWVYCFGGYGPPSFFNTAAVYAAPLSSSGIGAWQAGTSLPMSLLNEACDVIGSNVVCLGGFSSGAGYVESAPLSTSSPYVGTWTQYGDVYPVNTYDFDCLTFGSQIYCFGGDLNDAVGLNTSGSLVFSSADGGQTWSPETSLPYSDMMWSSGVAVSDGNFAYIIGGVQNEAWYPAVATNYVYSSSGFNVPTVTLPLSVCIQQTGAPSGIFTLAGAGVSPTTITSNCTSEDVTLDAGGTLTVTAPTDGTYSRYRMNPSDPSYSSPTTENIVSCSSGTCGPAQVNAYYQVSNTWQASTNGNGPPAWDTTSSGLRLATANGNSVVYYVPVTILNGQTSAIPSGFQEMITVNGNSYTSYLASDLSNVNWQDGNGNILASWRQSGTSSSDTSDVYWINLGSNAISANGGTLTIYLCFYGPSANVLNTINTGEFPTATGTYGQYDDGAKVFTFYDNFAGTSLSSQWTTAYGTFSVNNGLIESYPSDVAASFVPNPTGAIIESGYTTFATASGIDYEVGFASGTYSTSGSYWPDNGYSSANFASGGSYLDVIKYTGNVQSVFVTDSTGYPTSGTQYENGFVWAGSSLTAYWDTTSLQYSDSSFSLNSMTSLYIDHGGGGGSAAVITNWVRVRSYPPNAVMPSASFGAVGTWSPLSIPLTGTLNGASTTICTMIPVPGTTSAATCSGWSDYGASVTAPSLALGAAANTQWKLYGTSSYSPASGGNTESPFAYYKQFENTYQATPSSPATWDSSLTIPVTGTQGGASGTIGCSVTTSSGAGTLSCTGWFDYNTAVSLPSSLPDGTYTSWSGQAPTSFTQTTGGNTNNVNYYKGGEVSVSSSTVDPGQAATLSIVTPPSGGASPYTCEWMVQAPGGTSFNNLAASDCSSSVSTGALSTTGTWSFYLQVTDSNNDVVTSNIVTVTVIPLSVSVAPVTIDSGQSATLTAVATGGSSTYTTYAWYMGSTCSGTSLQTGSSASYATGTLTTTTQYCVKVTDSYGGTATTTVTVTVNPVVSVSITPSAPIIKSGQSLTLTANPAGGSGSYSYSWYQGTTCSGSLLGSSASYTTPAMSSTTTYCVKVTDSVGGTASATVTVSVIVGSWTSFNMPASDTYSCVYYSGYVYCQGETHSYYSPLTITGPSSWTAGPTYPITLSWGPACVQANGYMTCVGGSTGSGNVYSSKLSAGFGTWTSTTAYLTNIEANSCVQYSGYIYCVGGYVTALTSSSYYASLTSGVVGTWTSTTAYPVATDQLSCFVSLVSSTPYIVCTGGLNIGNGITTYYATISSTGIGSWSSGSVPNNAPSNPLYTVSDVGCAGDTTITYCIGGGNGSSATTPMATYVTNPTVGWETAARLPANEFFQSSTGCVLDDDVAGGLLLCVPTSSTTGYYIGASALVVTPTSLSWYAQNKIPTADGYSCAYYAGYIFCVGAGGETYYATASYGTVGTWHAGPTYPVTNTNWMAPACVPNAGYIYCVGGATSSSSPVSSSYYTTIGPSGFGSWTSTTSYPIVLALSSCQVYSSWIYCFGGYSGGGSYNNVYAAPLSSSGIGTWQAGTSLPLYILNAACVVSGSNVMCVGGWSTGDGQAEYATLTTSSPYVGAWTSYPGAYPVATYDFNCLTFSPRIYCFGGDLTEYVNINTASSLVFSTGDLGKTWQSETSLPYSDMMWSSGTAVSDGNFVYIIGGVQNELWPPAIPTNYVYSSSGFNVPTVTLPVKVCLMESGAPSGTFTLAGPGVSPTTVTSTCSTVNVTIDAGGTLTVTTPADTSSARYRMDSADSAYTSPTTENIIACSSGTCPTAQVNSYYQLSNTYQASTNGNGPVAWDGGGSLRLVTVSGNSVTYYVPVTLTNSQSSATPTGFQEMVTVSWASYRSYLASDLSNVNWQDGNGNILASWRETGISSSNSSAVYWVNLGSNTISANGGTLTIYLCFYGTSVKVLNTSNTGEFPTATATYGQYDDGAAVFNDYWNFAGTSLPSGFWYTSGTSATASNGLTVNGSNAILGTNMTLPAAGAIFEVDVTSSNVVAQEFNIGYGTSASSPNGGYGYSFIRWPGGSSGIYLWTPGSNGPTFTVLTSASSPAIPNIIGIGWNSAHQQIYLLNDGTIVTAASTTLTYSSSTQILTRNGGGGQYTAYWWRVRIYPPGNVMPSASFGAAVKWSPLSIAITGTVSGVGGTNICTISPVPGTTATASCSGWSDYGTTVTAPSLASGAATNIQWKLYGTSSYSPTSGGNTESPFTYYKQLQNTYEATPSSPTTWDAVLIIPVTGTLGGTGDTGCSITTAINGGTASCTGWFDYNTAVSLPATLPDGSGAQWIGAAPLSFTQTTGGNTNNVNYNLQYLVTFARSGLDSSATGTVVTVNGNPITYSSLPYSLLVNSGSSVTFSWTNPVTSNNSGEQFAFSSASLNSPFTVNAPVTITGTYLVQYQLSFAVSPSSSGSTSPLGTNVWENSGVLSIIATQNTSYEFAGWTATGSITIANPTLSSTAATVSGTGTITALFDSLPSVTASATPSTIDSGQTTILTATASDGSGSYTYAFYAGSCTATALQTGSSNTYTDSPTSTTTYCVEVTDSLGGAATTTVTVTVDADPTVAVTPAGPFTYDVGQSATTLTAAITYTGPNTVSVKWDSSSAAPCSGSSSNTGETGSSFTPDTSTAGTTYYCAVVYDSGIPVYSSSSNVVEIIVSPALSISINPSSVSIDADGVTSATFTLTTTGGSGENSYIWSYTSLNAKSGCGSTDTTCTITASSAGTFNVYATATDSNNGSATSNTATVTVSPALNISPLTTPIIIDVGQIYQYSTTAFGGTGTYSYAWSLSIDATVSSGCGPSDNTCTVLGAATGTGTTSVTVTDNNGGSASSFSTITVDPALTVSPSATVNPVDIGQSTTISASASGGSGTYTSYAWSGLPSGCGVPSNVGSFSCTPATGDDSLSPYTVQLVVTDSNGNSMIGTFSLTVDPALSAGTLSATFNPVDVNQETILSTSGASGGSNSYSYAWTNLPSGCSGSNSPSIGCTPIDTIGSPFTVTLTVTDTNGNTATATLTLTVDPALVVPNPTVDHNPADLGQSVTFTTSPTGGSGTYSTYTWTGLSVGCIASNSPAINCAPNTTGLYTISAAVTDSNGNTVTSSVLSFTVDADPTVAVAPVGPLYYNAGESATTLTATITYAGSNTTPIEWYSSATPSCSSSSTDQGSGNSFTPSTASAGITYYCAVVSDNGVSGYQSTSNAVEVNVDSITTTLSASEITVGGSAYDSATLAGVTSDAGGTVTYEYFTNDQSCLSTPTQTFDVTVSSGTVPSSPTLTFNTAGRYGWIAVYSGDSNNAGTTSLCEPFTTNKAASTISTTVYDGSTNTAWSGTETTGASAYDTATVTGVTGIIPTGTVTYTLYTNGDCSGVPSFTQTDPIGSPSGIQGPLAAGGYSYSATYSGDGNYNGSASVCELFTVGKATPSITSAVTPSTVDIGESAHDTASVTGVNAFTLTGSVQYTVYSDDACNFEVFTDTQRLGSSSITFTPTTPGVYQWIAAYLGNSNYDTVSTACGAEPLWASDFNMTTTSVVVAPVGSNSTSTLTLASLYGYNGDVNLTATVEVAEITVGTWGLGGGRTPFVMAPMLTLPTVLLSPSSVGLVSQGTGQANVTIILPLNVQAGDYTVTLTGTYQNIVHSVQFKLTVVDFDLGIPVSAVTIPPGGNSTFTLSIGSLNGFEGYLFLSASVSPSGPTVTLSPESLYLATFGTGSLVTITVPVNTPAGDYTLTIEANPGQLIRTVIITVSVPTAQTMSLATLLRSGGNASLAVLGILGLIGSLSIYTRGTRGRRHPQTRRRNAHMHRSLAQTRSPLLRSYPVVTGTLWTRYDEQ